MAFSATSDSIQPYLKIEYPDGIDYQAVKESKILNLIKKDRTGIGKSRQVNIRVSDVGGGGADYQEAYATQAATDHKNFNVTSRNEFSLCRVDSDAILDSQNDKQSIVRTTKTELESAGYRYGRAMHVNAWRKGGWLVKLTSATVISTVTITFANVLEAAAFNKGMWISFASDDGTGTSPTGLRDLGKRLQVTNITVVNGTATATLSAAINTVAGVANTDYVFQAGSYAKKMMGIPGFVPNEADLTGQTFFGLDRQAAGRLQTGGYYYAAPGAQLMESTLKNATAEASVFGCNAKKCFTNPLNWNDFEKSASNKQTYPVGGADLKLGFKALMVMTAIGEVEVIAETDVPYGYAWVINPDNFTLVTAGASPRNLNLLMGKNEFERVAGANSWQYDLGARGNFITETPGRNLCIKW